MKLVFISIVGTLAYVESGHIFLAKRSIIANNGYTIEEVVNEVDQLKLEYPSLFGHNSRITIKEPKALNCMEAVGKADTQTPLDLKNPTSITAFVEDTAECKDLIEKYSLDKVSSEAQWYISAKRTWENMDSKIVAIECATQIAQSMRLYVDDNDGTTADEAQGYRERIPKCRNAETTTFNFQGRDVQFNIQGAVDDAIKAREMDGDPNIPDDNLLELWVTKLEKLMNYVRGPFQKFNRYQVGIINLKNNVYERSSRWL